MEYGLGALAGIVVIVAIVIAVPSSSGSNGEGELAQDFEFEMFQGIKEIGFGEGNPASLHGLGSKPMVLNFWAGFCPPSRDAPVPSVLRGFQRRYPVAGH
ncbi:MAG: hypothetical protein FI710_14075 [SAR202 cluster bacterium]|jgi:thiol-disulfide isomerase/thioredoxin|nr:hypothetical protein [Dehalococcoidia bacterium]MQG56099.1 hypothetical protein [SAR202 cluster bacterium]|tara:strand:+ start:2060 stop:2359 length:300 start_codon:yes stop_codon:yes gene_type:complete